MPKYWPPPEEYEREKRRLDAIRPWHQAIAFGLGVMLVVGLVVGILRG